MAPLPSEVSTPAPPAASRISGERHPVRAMALVAGLVALGFAAAYGVSEAVDPVYKPSRQQYGRVVASAPEVRALSLGNSHSRGIDLDAMGLQGAELWNPGNDYYEVLHLLRSVGPRLPELEYVFVPVSLFVYDNATSPLRVELRKRAYVTTGNYRPVAGDWGAAFQALLAPVVRTDNWEGVAYRLAGRQPPATAEEVEERQEAALHFRVPPVDVLREHAVKRAGLHASTEQASLAEDPDLCAHARGALRRIAEAAPPARLVLYTPPYTPTYLAHRDPATGCGLSAFAAELAATTPGVTYFDDRALPAFSDRSGYFRDGDHINAYGAYRYSALLADRLGLDRSAAPPPPTPPASEPPSDGNGDRPPRRDRGQGRSADG
jgi:hypothetical protein